MSRTASVLVNGGTRDKPPNIDTAKVKTVTLPCVGCEGNSSTAASAKI